MNLISAQYSSCCDLLSMVNSYIILRITKVNYDLLKFNQIQIMGSINCCNSATTDKKPLYDRLGEQKGVDAVVDKFYENMLADDSINHFFKNIDMKGQSQKQKDFLAMVFGGPNNYKGRDMKDAHEHLKINQKDFDTTWKHLEDALNHYKVGDQERNEVKEIFFSVEDDVVTEKAKNEKSLYDRLGGEKPLSAVVDKFYEFMMVDPEVNHFFKNVDMKNQAQKQKDFLAMVFGGPNNYTGKDMKESHKSMKIKKSEFDKTWVHLKAALEHYKVPNPEEKEIQQIFYSVEGQIVTDYEGKSLFDRLGGQGPIDAVVDKFYEYMLADQNISHFFKTTNMKDQADKQKTFMAMAFGGPNNYTGKDMKESHKHLKIAKKDFEATWYHLKAALEFYEVPSNLVTEVGDVVYSVEGDVVTVNQ